MRRVAIASAAIASIALGCSDASLQAILAARPRPALPTCSDGVRNASETDTDCGGPNCAACATGQSCTTDSDCTTPCVQNRCWVARTCADLHVQRPSLIDGVYAIHPERADAIPPFPAYCDMSGALATAGTATGGWTRVAFEPAGVDSGLSEMPDSGTADQGGLAYLGRTDVGSPEAVAQTSSVGLLGARFAGAYREVSIRWGEAYMRFTPGDDLFQNTVALQIPLTNFATNDVVLNGWVLSAGGAMFCRASRWPDVRPGDTSWAVKPVGSIGSECGCNDLVWFDRGAFYGGGVPNTSCTLPRGGNWAGVKDIRDPKAGMISPIALSIWVR